jgi:hypothetical protein
VGAQEERRNMRKVDEFTRSYGHMSSGSGVGPEAEEKHESGIFRSSQQRKAGGPSGGAGINFTDHGGPVIPNAHLQFIFWGAAWTTGTPSIGQVTDAVVNIITGPYMDLLSQYRNIGHATLFGTTLVSSAVGGSPANPPSPFNDGDISGLISNLCQAGRLPSPATDSELFYCVILPPGVNSGGGFIGEHTYFSLDGVNCHFAWVMNNGTLDYVTTVFSHELVETVTDPEGSAILGDPGSCNQSGWCEIGDVCEGNTTSIRGIVVQRYWSQRDKSCAAPGDKVVKDDKDSKDTKDVKDKEKDKEHKDTKDHKDAKDHKETKEGAKEKELIKDQKEKERDFPLDLTAVVGELSSRVDQLSQQVDQIAASTATGRAFIRPQERPPVGGQALRGSKDPTES